MNPLYIYIAIFAVLAVAVILITTSGSSRIEKSIQKVSTGRADTSIAARAEANKDGRRKQIQDTLKDLEKKANAKKKALTLQDRLAQAGLDIEPKIFWIASAVMGGLLFVIVLVAGASVVVAALGGLVGFLGVPRWLLNKLGDRRREKFINDLADGIEIMVRSLKTGLPVNDALSIIGSELGEPVGPEFMEVVEGQRVGISIPGGFERMYERMPLAEVNFLSIVIGIQAKTGGNLAEALSNLARVLRDRKKMKLKIKSISQEVRTSAKIIGALPFVITGGIAVTNPEFLEPLFTTNIGHMLLVGSGIYMSIGIVVMVQMIKIDI